MSKGELEEEVKDKWPQWVTPRRSKLRDPRPYVTLDIESRNWRDMDLIGIFDGKEYRTYWRVDYLLRDLERRYKGHDVFAHYGGGFDFWFLLPYIRERYKAVELTRAKSRLASIKIKEHDIRILDSYSIAPYSLAELAKAYNLDYKVITGDWSKVGDLELRERNRVDVRTLFDVIAIWRRFAAEAKFKGDTPSVGAAAVDCWLRSLKGPMQTMWDGRRLADNAYYGGRVEAYERESEGCWWYDLNSAYGWAMSHYVPEDSGIHLGPKRLTRELMGRQDVVCIVHCVVEIPDWVPVGPLPVRIADSDESAGYRVDYPKGVEVHGCWVSVELEAAQRMGARIVEVIDAVVYSASRVFAPWVKRIFSMRGKYPLLAKRLINSLYGKLGQRLESNLLYLNPASDEIVKKAMTPYLDPKHGVWVWSQVSKAPTKLLPIAATVAARVRARLTSLMASLAAWGNKVVYCDTDAVVYEGEKLPDNWVGLGLGEWKLVGQVRKWRCLASRWYAADLSAIGDSDVVVKLASAGIERMTERDFRELVKGGSIDRKRWIGWHSQMRAVVAEGKGYPEYETIQVEYDDSDRARLKFANRCSDLSDIERRLYYKCPPEW